MSKVWAYLRGATLGLLIMTVTYQLLGTESPYKVTAVPKSYIQGYNMYLQKKGAIYTLELVNGHFWYTSHRDRFHTSECNHSSY